MTTTSIRSFAGGLIVCAAICLIVFNVFVDTEPTIEEMIVALEKNDYKVEKVQLVGEVHNPEVVESNIPKQESVVPTSPVVEESSPVVTITITVTAGMTSIDVGKMLEVQKVVASSKEFYNAVVASGRETKLKQGTFSIPSNATVEQIINIIFK